MIIISYFCNLSPGVIQRNARRFFFLRAFSDCTSDCIVESVRPYVYCLKVFCWTLNLRCSIGMYPANAGQFHFWSCFLSIVYFTTSVASRCRMFYN
jgi:hypothetical protein